MADEQLAALADLSRRLEDGARRLRDDGLGPDEAVRIADELAELASQAAVELDRIARASADPDEVPGQEELL
jgi:hypothetical protein